ncbi:MAG: DUF2199 domain-containing protein [Solirubrobacterales bacterium]
MSGFQCSICGSYHDQLPFSYGVPAPDLLYAILPEERRERCLLTSDQCIVDTEICFVRGILYIPVIDSPDLFFWGVWVELEQDEYDRMHAAWKVPGRELDPPYYGRLATRLPVYPDTLQLRVVMRNRAMGEAPLVLIEPCDHPLSAEQQNGVTLGRVQEIAEYVLHVSAQGR